MQASLGWVIKDQHLMPCKYALRMHALSAGAVFVCVHDHASPHWCVYGRCKSISYRVKFTLQGGKALPLSALVHVMMTMIVMTWTD